MATWNLAAGGLLTGQADQTVLRQSSGVPHCCIGGCTACRAAQPPQTQAVRPAASHRWLAQRAQRATLCQGVHVHHLVLACRGGQILGAGGSHQCKRETISRVPQPRHVVPLDAAASTPRPLSEPRLVEDALQPHPPPAYSSPAASCHLMSWYVERGRPSGQATARGGDSTARAARLRNTRCWVAG